MNSISILLLIICAVLMSCSSSQTKVSNEIKEDQPTGFFESSYGKIAYFTNGKGPKLILLHAAGHDHRDFAAILPTLSEHYEVTSFDWPGHGKSTWSHREEISAIYFPKILNEFLEKKAPEGSILLGNSVGGYAALQLTLERPNFVKGLILVDTGGMNELDFPSKSFIKLKSYPWFTSMIWNLFPKYYTKNENVHTERILDHIKFAKLKPDAVEMNASIWKSFLDERYNLRNSVSEIKKPTLIIWGKNDPVIYPKFGQDLRERIEGSQIQFLDTGHLPFAENPEKFLEIVSSFFSNRNL